MGFRARLETFLFLASRHRMTVMPVLFDSCWDPFPQPGPQPAPVPGVHNSRWVQSPGATALQDPAQYRRLEDYVAGVVGAFATDDRVLGWDVWNEPDNLNPTSYGRSEPSGKVGLVLDLLPRVFDWARSAGAQQPLTSGVWQGDWSDDATLAPMARLQLTRSDIISFHCYGQANEFAARVRSLLRFGRPVLCTEYMARPFGSTFETIAPLAKRLGVAALNWGLVAGRTQTWLPWDSWQNPYIGRSPPVWFHDVFRPDGGAYAQGRG